VDDMIAFLNTRLDEDVQRAQKDLWVAGQATPGHWQGSYGFGLPYSRVKTDDGTVIMTAETVNHQGDAGMAERFQPETVRGRAQRMIREVAAKRRLIGEFRSRSSPDVAEIYLAVLAAVYSDHPDYRQEWAS
jgi:Family of unknown function (DUF6221)